MTCPPRGIARLYLAAVLTIGPPLFLLLNWSA